jgi:hypothetical protein
MQAVQPGGKRSVSYFHRSCQAAIGDRGSGNFVKQMLTAVVLLLFLPPLLGAQEKVKFPVGVSSKVMNGIEKRRRNFWRSSFSLRRASPRKGWTIT